MERSEREVNYLLSTSGEQLFNQVLDKNFDMLHGHKLLFLCVIGNGPKTVVVKVACSPPIKGFSTFALKIVER